MPRDPEADQRHWQDLVEALAREATAMGGFGELTLRLTFHHGRPCEICVVQRSPHYHLGGGAPPLTGAAPARIMLPTE